MALSDQDPAKDNDAQAYRWMAAAHDFGHARAWKKMRSLLEISSLRYDDGGLVTGQMHYELGMDYLRGCHGLPLDMIKASKNLALGREGILGTDHDLEADRRRLAGEPRRVFDVVYPPGESTPQE